MSLSKQARQVAVIPYVGRKSDQLSYLVVRMAEKIEQLEAELQDLKQARMVGFFAKLTDEQKKAALEYKGEDL